MEEIHPALPNKYSTLNIWFIPENANSRMSIQLNCCSIGGCTAPSIAYQQRKCQTSLNGIAFDLCVEFSRWCLAPFITRTNEWTNEWMSERTIVCLWRWIYLEIDVILHHRKFDPQTNRTHTYVRIYAHTHILHPNMPMHTYVCIYMFRPSTFNNQHVLHFGIHHTRHVQSHVWMRVLECGRVTAATAAYWQAIRTKWTAICSKKYFCMRENEREKIVRVNDITYSFLFFWVKVLNSSALNTHTSNYQK